MNKDECLCGTSIALLEFDDDGFTIYCPTCGRIWEQASGPEEEQNDSTQT